MDANGAGRTVIATDTVLRGIFGLQDGAQPPRLLRRNRYAVNLFAHLRQFHDQLSYITDWRDAFVASPRLEVEICNINNLIHFGRCLGRIRRYDLIIVSHAATGDDMTLMLRAAGRLSRRACPMVVFLGNEYDLLDDKVAFIRRARAEWVCSQLPLAAAEFLYQGIEGTGILSAPHALNPNVYSPPAHEARDIDIGFVGDLYWPFVGDEERTLLIRHFEQNGSRYGLNCDIRAGRSTRLARDDWADFLRRSKGLIGAESGTYYLNERGDLLNRARSYNLNENQDASFKDVFERFYAGVERGVSGKSISSRHFEPIGTKTCQILLEGDYNGILKAGEHYIPVKRDLSDIDEAVREFRDDTRRRQIADQTYDYVMSAHTYAHRVADIVETVL